MNDYANERRTGTVSEVPATRWGRTKVYLRFIAWGMLDALMIFDLSPVLRAGKEAKP